jgi:hypothetical protein
MKPLAFLAIVLLAIVGLAYQCSAAISIPGLPSGGGGGSSNTPSVFYVLVQMSGDDVSCTLYTTTDDLKKQEAAVAKQNVEIVKANTALNAEIIKLKAQLAGKTRELTKAADDDAKAPIQKDIDDLKGQIADKQGQQKPVVKLFDPRRFNNRNDAEVFMENTYKEAEKMKEKKLQAADKKKGSA